MFVAVALAPGETPLHPRLYTSSFDVVVTPNLYGDVLSDVAAQIAGSVGLAGSANIGDQVAMFEAIHGSAPRRAGQDVASPSGLLMGAVMMLVQIVALGTNPNLANARSGAALAESAALFLGAKVGWRRWLATTSARRFSRSQRRAISDQ